MSRFSFFCLLLWTQLSWMRHGRTEEGQTPLEKGRVARRSYFFQEAGRRLDYALYVPNSYRPERPTPLIVLLHGLASNPLQVIHYRGIMEEAERRGYIVVAPTGYHSAGWYGSQGPGRDFRISWLMPRNSPLNLGELSEKDVLEVLARTRKEYRVAPDRIYLMGHSMGGAGALYLGAKYPATWAAVAALSPARVAGGAALSSLRHTPVRIVQGGADVLVKADATRRTVSELREGGVTCEYEEIKGGDHLFSIAVNPGMIARLFDFFDAHRLSPAAWKEASAPAVVAGTMANNF